MDLLFSKVAEPGNGILFEDGIHATIANTGGVTITFT
jgi:hypothetical protein